MLKDSRLKVRREREAKGQIKTIMNGKGIEEVGFVFRKKSSLEKAEIFTVTDCTKAGWVKKPKKRKFGFALVFKQGAIIMLFPKF